MSRPVPDATIATIKALRAKGHSLTEIAAKVGHAKSCVSRHAAGIRKPLKSGPKPKVSRAAIRHLKADGLSIRKIAAAVGAGSTTVHKALKSRSAA